MKIKTKKNDIELIKQYKVEPLIANILINRGISPEEANSLFNNPYSLLKNPNLLINGIEAAQAISNSINEEKEIWVYGDYDVDGITSGYSLVDFLKTVTNNDIFLYLPERTEGYGLDIEFCNKIIERRKEIDKDILIITVDNGVTRVEEVAYLKANNIDIIITDHHKPKEVLPDCIVVNPHIEQNDRYHHLCGCGVVFKLIQIMQQQLDKDYANKYYHVVALATIADVMPLNLENLAIIKIGLEQLNSKDCPKSFAQFKKFLNKDVITPIEVSWDIAPRLNACGRMGDIELAANLLFFKDIGDIKSCLIDIEEINDKRKELTKNAMKEIDKINFNNTHVCVYHDKDFPIGLTGPIANKISETNNKPALVITGSDELIGSARSVGNINLQELLESEMIKGHLSAFGGHEMAAGFSLKYDYLNNLTKSLEQLKLELPNNQNKLEEIIVDDEIQLIDLNKGNYLAINSLAYTRDNTPLFIIKDLEVIKTHLSANNTDNIELTVRDKNNNIKKIWAWRQGNNYYNMCSPKNISLIGEVKNDFMNKRNYTFDIKYIIGDDSK